VWPGEGREGTKEGTSPPFPYFQPLPVEYLRRETVYLYFVFP
jgi:hypothetical protein